MLIKNKDIARILNISPAAVSLARNGKAGVSEHTRKMVKDLLQEMEQQNDRPSDMDIKGGIVFVIHKKHGKIITETPFFLSLTEEIQRRALARGYHVTILQYYGGDDIGDFIKRILEIHALGVLLLATELDSDDLEVYQQIGLPIVLIDSNFMDKKLDAVTINNIDAVYEIVSYAKQCGHREIGFLKSKVENNNFYERYLGFQAALDRMALPFYPEYVFEVGVSSDYAYIDMKQILEEKRKLPTVLIAGNDMLAIGALRALKEAGIKVPEDISMIGFDDMPVSRMMDPPLTSIRIYNDLIGECAINRLIQKIETGGTGHFTTRVGCDLMIRDSVKTIQQL